MGTSEVTTDDVLDAIHDHPDPVVTAPELADRLPCVTRTVNNRLSELTAAEDVEKKKVGGRAAVYWLPGTRKPRRGAAPRERSLKPDQADLESVAGGESAEGTGGPTGGREAVREAVEDLDLPGSGETLEGRRQALVDLYDHLQMKGSAQKSEFLKVLDASPHGYQSPESAWSNLVKGKETLHSLPGVTAPGEGEHTWRFDG